MSENQLFEHAIKDYLESCSTVKLSQNIRLGIPEFEIRFGISTPISKTDYDNVVRELFRNKWSSKNIDGTQLLRISTEFYDAKQNVEEDADTDNALRGGAGAGRRNQYKMSNIRLEIVGADMIEIYCKTNSLEALKNTPAANKKLKFTQKKSAPRLIGPFINGKNLPFIDYKDFNFRISSQFELGYPITSDNETVRKIMHDWNPAAKHFRSINRVRFILPGSVVAVDISIIKSNKTYSKRVENGKFKKIPIPCQTIQEAGVFVNSEIYEVELELDNDAITIMVDSKRKKIEDIVQDIMAQIRKAIRTVLSGLQGTPYPISYVEQEDIVRDYMCRMHGDKWVAGKVDEDTREKYPFPYFIGPSSVTLQMENVIPSINTTSPNIALDYTVTEKADGQRCLLYISKKGKIYMINQNMKVMFTGAITESKECFDSLLDGEYIDYGKHLNRERTFLHLFAAFDIYFLGSRKEANVRDFPFCTNQIVGDEDVFRLPILEKFVSKLKVKSVVENQACLFQVRCKTFYKGIESRTFGKGMEPVSTKKSSPKEEGEEDEIVEEKTIFEGVEMIWTRREMFEYEIDGLIFTPMNFGVGGIVPGKASDLRHVKWMKSFKWKPPHYNTIDFLVTTKKDKFGKDLIRNKILTDENNEISTILQYKTLILKCGFNPKKDKFVNAFNDMLFNRFSPPNQDEVDNDETTIIYGQEYQPVPFQPTSPYDPEACFCNIVLQKDPVNTEQLYMRTLENDVFQEDTIVEFSYNMEATETESAWKWVPLRVRYDKTSELRENKNNFGNHFSVANDNWHSIHFPITEKMIMGQEEPRENMLDDTVYYNRMDKDSMETQPLKDFHNLFVKLYIIQKVAKYLLEKVHVSDILLMDYAVGKAGDLFKWKTSKISFVFGVDIAKDNIMNVKDGACARYLTEKVKNPRIPPRAIFLHGNSGLNIRHNQKAFYTNQEKDICRAVFGNGGDSKKMAKEYLGIARDGFHISSCQFAMHYFFEKKASLHSFLRNLCECTRLGGYFVGTCYNGQRIFDALKKKKMGESIRLDKNGKKIFEISREYSNQIEHFPQNDKSIGLAINVFQESINKTFKEYLVNFTYFSRIMEDYGFVSLTKAEITSMNIVDTNASFELLFRNMEREIRENPKVYYGQALNMSKEEKTISFFNQFFLYKKVRNVTLEQLEHLWKTHVSSEMEEEEEEEEEGEKTKIAVKAKKVVGKRIVLSLENYAPIKESIPKVEETEVPVKASELGEWELVMNRLPKDVQEKIRKVPIEKQIALLKKMQAPRTKIVTAAK